MKAYPSIFNDVLSPVTPGPSSSNTCGPFRIGKLLRQLLGGTPAGMKIEMAEKGGYSQTFYGMHSDKAFIGGILGKDLHSYQFNRAYDDAQKEGMTVEVEFNDSVSSIPTELSIITIENSRRRLCISAASLGGGEIFIDRINGAAVAIDGKRYYLIVETNDQGITCRPSTRPFDQSLIDEVEQDPRVNWYSITNPVYEILPVENSRPPFESAAGMLAYVEKKGISLWQAAIDYETSICGLPGEAVWNLCQKVYDLTIDAIEKGYRVAGFEGVTTPKASKAADFYTSGRAIPLGMASAAAPEALAIMEYSNAHGTIVCMPTGGSSGIIVPAIRNSAMALGLSEADERKALLTAGLIGTFYYPTHYSGDLGCQAEIGIAVSMAAGALASLMTDDVRTIERAAVLGAQSLLGLLCDPIDGYVQVPCFIRNMTAVPTAAVCANSAMAGLDTLVSLDEMAQTILRTGEKLYSINDYGVCYCSKLR
ncbi:L-serine ammonia-lyase, iron-sulfur-dependent, subunit alpha [Anaerovorax odorimutans]|nr:L-serine ammonia-lyase, iron-sulfur-dependent, subunit alpha [Anaerovorax odorimutans]